MKIVGTLFATIAFATLCSAQDMAELLKLGQPSEHHKALVPMQGKFKVEATFIMSGQEGKSTATMESKWILGGRFLQMNYESILFGSPFSVIQFLGYDNAEKQHLEMMMDSMATQVIFNKGTCSADGKTITHTGKYSDPATKESSVMKTIYKIVDNDKFIIEWWETKGKEPETKTVTLVHTRVKD